MNAIGTGGTGIMYQGYIDTYAQLPIEGGDNILYVVTQDETHGGVGSLYSWNGTDYVYEGPSGNMAPVDISNASIANILAGISEAILKTNRYLSYFQVLTNKDASGRQNVNVNTGSIAISAGTITTVGTVSTITAGTITTLQNLTNMGGQDAKTFQNNLGFIAYALNRRARVNYT